MASPKTGFLGQALIRDITNTGVYPKPIKTMDPTDTILIIKPATDKGKHLEVGWYKFELTVKDDQGLTGTVVQELTVTDTSPIAVINCTPSKPTHSEAITLDASKSQAGEYSKLRTFTLSLLQFRKRT